jgi:hypothetical protein
MTPEKRAELLHYAADNPDARFISKEFNTNYGLIYPTEPNVTHDIKTVTCNEYFDDWEIYEEPKDEVSYDYVRVGRFKTLDETKDNASLCGGEKYIKITKSPNGEVKVEIVK